MREAVILAGGFGARLKSVLPDLPKAMAPVAGRPFLALILNNLSSQKFKRVIISVGFMADSIMSYFGDSYDGLELVYVVEDKPLGTGGALRLALIECSQDHVFIFNGDTFLDFEVEDIEDNWMRNKASIIIGVDVEDTSRYGRLSFEHNRVQGFLEKGLSGPGVINAGCYVFKRNQLDKFDVGKPFSLEADYLTGAVRDVDFELFITKGKFIDIGVPEDYRLAQTLLGGLNV